MIGAPSLERAHGCGAKPQIPIQIGRNRILATGTLHALRPDRPVGDAVDFRHVAQHAAVDVFINLSVAVVRVTLVAHLRGHLELVDPGQQLPGLPYRMNKRLLRVTMLARFHGQRSGQIVMMVGRRHHDRVDVLHFLLQQDAVILIKTRLRPMLRHAALAILVDIAMRHHDIAGLLHHVDMRSALACGGDQSDAQFVALVLGVKDVRKSESAGRGCSAGHFQE